MVSVTVSIDFNRIALSNALASIDRPAMNTVSRVCEVAKDEAIKNYRSKRKSKHPTSMIINSFVVKSPVKHATGYIGYVYAETPYLIWVDQGHTLRNKKHWPGYHFMAAGALLAAQQVPIIADEEFSMAFK